MFTGDLRGSHRFSLQYLWKRAVRITEKPYTLLRHSIRFWVFLSKIVKYDFWLFQLFLVFSKSLYHELSGYVSNISIVCHTLLQEVQEHSPFCSFSWKFRFLLLAQVGKQVQNFTGGPRGIQIQLFLHKIGSTNMLIIDFLKKLGAIKV